MTTVEMTEKEKGSSFGINLGLGGSGAGGVNKRSFGINYIGNKTEKKFAFEDIDKFIR